MKNFGFNLRAVWLVVMMFMAVGGYANSPTSAAKRSPLKPDYIVAQYAGNIAKYSAGVGWEYGHDRWSTEVLLGWIPKFSTRHDKYTITVKQTFTPWHLTLPIAKTDDQRFSFSPLTCGIYMNSVVGSKQFWTVEPKRVYGGDYYRFSTRIRFALTLGQRLSYHFPSSLDHLGRGIDLYYEFSMSDLALISAIPNDRLNLGEILTLGIGARWKL